VGLAVTDHHRLVHPFTDSSHLCLPDHTPPLAMTDHYLPLHHSTCGNQILSVCTLFHWQDSNVVCTPFHWQESNVFCVHAIPLAGIKRCLCAHCSTCRNQTLSVCILFHWQESNFVCTPFQWQESNLVCVHAIPVTGIKHCLYAHHSIYQSQALQTPTHSLFNLGIRDFNFTPLWCWLQIVSCNGICTAEMQC
jgi:hypothetical protein